MYTCKKVCQHLSTLACFHFYQCYFLCKDFVTVESTFHKNSALTGTQVCAAHVCAISVINNDNANFSMQYYRYHLGTGRSQTLVYLWHKLKYFWLYNMPPVIKNNHNQRQLCAETFDHRKTKMCVCILEI